LFFGNKGENNMDILSFILGMSIVVVIAVAVVAVMAFVRVSRLNKEIREVEQCLGREIEIQNRERESAINDVYRVLDSRLDKLESRITTSRKA